MSDTSPLLSIGPLLPTALTLVHFYLQVWHLPIFTHSSDTSPLLPTGLTLEGERQKISGFCHFYSRNLCSRNSRSRDWISQTAIKPLSTFTHWLILILSPKCLLFLKLKNFKTSRVVNCDHSYYRRIFWISSLSILIVESINCLAMI